MEDEEEVVYEPLGMEVVLTVLKVLLGLVKEPEYELDRLMELE